MNLDIWKNQGGDAGKSYPSIPFRAMIYIDLHISRVNMYLPGFQYATKYINSRSGITPSPKRRTFARHFGSNHVTSLRMNVTQSSGSLFCNFR